MFSVYQISFTVFHFQQIVGFVLTLQMGVSTIDIVFSIFFCGPPNADHPANGVVIRFAKAHEVVNALRQ